ncbi:hypothetical protein [Alistipes putredinis]|uniref:hypothetical protein n=1 Tax=Alistipes putredinis TaxID=28117 RepID=UPI003AB75A51
MIEKEFVPIERILDNLLVMQSDELADIIEIPNQLYDSLRRFNTESLELRNERICFLVIIRIITGEFLFL